MKVSFLLLLVTSFSFTFAQNIGDYRSKNTGDWNQAGSWEVYDGSTWGNATSAPTSASTASPVVNVSTGSFSATAANNSYSLTLAPNATTVKAGDLLIVFWSDNQQSNSSVTTPSGWTSIYNGVYPSYHWAVAFYKVAVGGETAVTFAANNIDNQAVYIVYRINSGSYNGLPKGIYANLGNTVNATPPSLNVSDLDAGTKLCIVTSHSHSLSNSERTSVPSGFSNNYNRTQNNTTIRTASKLDAAASLITPGPFSNSNNSIGASTIALSIVSTAKVSILNNHIITITENATANDVVVETGGTLTVNSTFNLDIASGKSLSVSGTIKLPGTSYIAGSGNLSMNNNATIEIGSTSGISTGTSSGNIRVSGTRTFATTVSYVFNASSNQSIGDGMPPTAKKVTLAGGNVKTFSNALLDISESLIIESSSTMIIPDTRAYSAGKLYFGSDEQLKSYWAGTDASVPFTGSASPFSYFLAPSNYIAYKNTNFGVTTSGILKVGVALLPVTLTTFNAKPTTNGTVNLNWSTSTEVVNKGFRIERQLSSTNGKYESIGFVASKAQNGNSQTDLYYNFTDNNAKSHANSYYRLAQVDLDGATVYSEVRVVKLSGQTVSMVFPNPSNGAVNISRTANGKKMNVQVIDMAGRMLQQFNGITDSNFKVNISKSGMYSIKITYPESGEQSVQRIVIEK